MLPDEVDVCHQRLAERGVEILEPPTDQALGNRRIPADISSLSLPPAFGSQVQAVTLKPGISSHTFQLEVVGTEVERVFAEIIQPGFRS